jgi:hypothetical protein
MSAMAGIGGSSGSVVVVVSGSVITVTAAVVGTAVEVGRGGEAAWVAEVHDAASTANVTAPAALMTAVLRREWVFDTTARVPAAVDTPVG